jgi:hypothetical protein
MLVFMRLIYVLVVVILMLAVPMATQAKYDEDQQLTHFSQLIGGKWWLSDNQYLTFEWRLEKTQIRITRVLLVQGEENFVLEGVFYYSPDTFSIKGIATSVEENRHPQLLEYIGTASSDRIELMYKSISPQGEIQVFSETWTKQNANKFTWQLESIDASQPLQTGEVVRRGGF